ncbi:cytochrome P450 6a8-like [Adelges cooleyi]|uniref:cytochrome P450 6a8-like n=1 Tax=Adelges cooleyi TaxID=133065 RepID=UPI00217F8F39|nr:cytochrome P450 6a8-like [Adelges cooleyi]
MYSTLALESLAFAAFVVIAVLLPYVRRKHNYWTSRGVPVAAGQSVLTTLPVCRLDEKALTAYREVVVDAPVMGLHDAGKPCALACEVRVASVVLGNDSFVEDDGTSPAAGFSRIPNVLTEDAMYTLAPVMAECVAELTTSMEAIANRRMTVTPRANVKRCATIAVATCVYGQPIIDSQMKTFEDNCEQALRARRDPVATAKHMSAYEEKTSANCFKTILCKAANTETVDFEVRSDLFTFVTCAIESTANLVTAALYELSRDHQTQSLLREHLDSVLDEHSTSITVEQMDRVPYLENVIRETFRKYPISPVIRRVAIKPYTVEKQQKSVTIEPGVLTLVPVHAYHHDKRHFANPEEFQPHRFPGQLSSAYMPYGSGPQSYIGKNFVSLEAKMIIAMLISKYEFNVNSAEPGRTPDPFDKSSFAGVKVQLSNRLQRDRTLEESLRHINEKNKLFKLF